MKRLLPILLLCLVSLVSCQEELTRNQKARAAAEGYYQCLIEERYADYVAGMQDADSMTTEYRQEMVDLVAEFGARVKKNRGGMAHAEAVGDTLIGDFAHVFVCVTYADSTRETVGLQLVQVGETWKMK